MREVQLKAAQLPAAGLRALLVWMYTERVDVPVEQVRESNRVRLHHHVNLLHNLVWMYTVDLHVEQVRTSSA